MTEEIEVQIFGHTFRVTAGEAMPDYIQRLACYVDERIRAVAASSKTMPLNNMAILTALNIADDLFKLQDRYEQSTRLLSAKTESLIALVQKQLTDE